VRGWSQRTCFNSAPVVSRNLCPSKPQTPNISKAANLRLRKTQGIRIEGQSLGEVWVRTYGQPVTFLVVI
jgi:hypothetical protein